MKFFLNNKQFNLQNKTEIITSNDCGFKVEVRASGVIQRKFEAVSDFSIKENEGIMLVKSSFGGWVAEITLPTNAIINAQQITATECQI